MNFVMSSDTLFYHPKLQTMFNVLSDINWLSVLVAFIAYFLLGPLWYLFLFPKQYRISLGKAPDAQLSQDPIYIVGPAVCTLAITLTSTVLLYALNSTTYNDAVSFTVLVGVGYLVANTINIAINPNIPRPFLYGVITGSYHLIGTLLVSVILIAMK